MSIADTNFRYDKKVTDNSSIIDKFVVYCDEANTNNVFEKNVTYFTNDKVKTIAELNYGCYHDYYKQYFQDSYHSYEEGRYSYCHKHIQQRNYMVSITF